MSDLISRSALKEHKFVGNKYVQIGGRTNGKTLENINKAYQQGWNDAIDAIIDNSPTVNPYFPISEEAFYKMTDAEFEFHDSFWVSTPSGKKFEFEKKRPQSKWEHNKFDEHYCNKCGIFALYEEEADGNYYEVQSNFCPNCGLPMRKGEEE